MEEVHAEDVAEESRALGARSSVQRRSKRRPGKKTPPLERQRSRSEVRDELGLTAVMVVFRALGVLMVGFACLALLGGILQAVKDHGSKDARLAPIAQQVQGAQETSAGQTREMLAAASIATWQATRLWARVIWIILVPTSHQTFRITKEGYAALQPSLKASWNFLIGLSLATKAVIAAVVASIAAAWALHRWIRRKRFVERTVARYNAKVDAFSRFYDRQLAIIERQSKIVAALFPHVLFLSLTGLGYVFMRNEFAEFSRSLGGWFIVIGLPIILATKALIFYDMEYRKQIEAFYGSRRRRTFSELPTPETARQQNLAETATSIFGRWIPGLTAGSRLSLLSHHRRNSEEEDDASSISSLDSTDVNSVDGIKYPRQIENDPEASLKQYEELQDVVYWMQYWTVLGVALLAEQMPLSGHILAALPMWPPIRVLWALWLQMPGTIGAKLSFKLFLPLIDALLGSVDTPSVSAEQQNLLVNLLFGLGLISQDSRVKLAEMMETGGTLMILGFVLFLMPSTITGIGAIAIGIGRPVLSATRALIAIERAEKITRNAAIKQDANSIKKFKANKVSISNAAVQCTQWLQYWVVYTVIMLFHGFLNLFLFWFPLWNHLLLMLTLWLQLPYFRGAHRIFKVALSIFYRMRALFVKDRSGGGELHQEDGRALSPIEEVAEDDANSTESKRQSSKRGSRRKSSKRSSSSVSSKAHSETDARVSEEDEATEVPLSHTTWAAWMFGGGSSTPEKPHEDDFEGDLPNDDGELKDDADTYIYEDLAAAEVAFFDGEDNGTEDFDDDDNASATIEKLVSAEEEGEQEQEAEEVVSANDEISSSPRSHASSSSVSSTSSKKKKRKSKSRSRRSRGSSSKRDSTRSKKESEDVLAATSEPVPTDQGFFSWFSFGLKTG